MEYKVRATIGEVEMSERAAGETRDQSQLTALRRTETVSETEDQLQRMTYAHSVHLSSFKLDEAKEQFVAGKAVSVCGVWFTCVRVVCVP